MERSFERDAHSVEAFHVKGYAHGSHLPDDVPHERPGEDPLLGQSDVAGTVRDDSARSGDGS
jgi:hypothetical protein